jgi:predicted transcriptional regulator of viral defense system
VTSRARSRGRDVTGIAISEQLISAGASPVQVRRLARQGRLLMVRRGVYAPADLAAAAVEDHVKRHAMRLAAVAVKSGYRTVGSHQTAAVLHGLDLIGRPSANLVTVTRSPRDHGSRASRMSVRVHSAELPRGHVVVRDGIRLTSVARTVVDLARTCSFRDGVVVADSALRTGQTTAPEISAVISDCARWPGVRRARAVAAFSDHRAESALESIGRLSSVSTGCPPRSFRFGWAVTSGSSAGRTTSGRGTGRSRKPTAPSSTRIRGRRCANSAGMRGCAMRASK